MYVILKQDETEGRQQPAPRDSLQLLPPNPPPPVPVVLSHQVAVPSSVPSSAVPSVPSNRSRVKKSTPGNSLMNIPSALSVSTYRSQLPLLMDNLLDKSVSMDEFSHQLDTYIQKLLTNLHKPLQKRAQIIGQASYKKPEVAQVYAFQAKTSVSLPICSSIDNHWLVICFLVN